MAFRNLASSEPAKFGKALSLLTHRGPDAKGLWTITKNFVRAPTPCNHRHYKRCSATNASARSLFDGIQWRDLIRTKARTQTLVNAFQVHQTQKFIGCLGQMG